jgi:hypothetical protein
VLRPLSALRPNPITASRTANVKNAPPRLDFDSCRLLFELSVPFPSSTSFSLLSELNTAVVRFFPSFSSVVFFLRTDNFHFYSSCACIAYNQCVFYSAFRRLLTLVSRFSASSSSPLSPWNRCPLFQEKFHLLASTSKRKPRTSYSDYPFRLLLASWMLTRRPSLALTSKLNELFPDRINNFILAASSIAITVISRMVIALTRKGETATDFQTLNTNAACISGDGCKSANEPLYQNVGRILTASCL